MRFEDTIEVMLKPTSSYDANGNPVAEEEESGVTLTKGSDEEPEWTPFSKCFLSFNSKADKVRLNDGSEYMYSYYAICPLTKGLYSSIPKEGDRVHLVKADGTIDVDMEVKGFVTYKRRYLKIWV